MPKEIIILKLFQEVWKIEWIFEPSVQNFCKLKKFEKRLNFLLEFIVKTHVNSEYILAFFKCVCGKTSHIGSRMYKPNENHSPPFKCLCLCESICSFLEFKIINFSSWSYLKQSFCKVGCNDSNWNVFWLKLPQQIEFLLKTQST